MEPFGRVYGALSEDFTHIGQPFRLVQSGIAYSKDESALWHCLGVLMSILWLTYQVTELVFLDSAEQPRFWRRLANNTYQLEFCEAAREWQSRLVSRYKEFMPEAAVK